MTKFVGVIEREDTVTIDGYSDKKTIKGCVAEVAKLVSEYSEVEADALVNQKEDSLFPVTEGCDYFFTIDEVGCASSMNEETDEMEYADGNFYFCITFVK